LQRFFFFCYINAFYKVLYVEASKLIERDRTKLAEDKGFEKIIERNGKSIYKIAFVYMKNRFDADDVYQEVLLRYLKYRPHFENCEHEKNWFVAVTINVCKSFKTSAWQRHNVTVDDDSWSQILADNTESREIS